MTDGPFRAQAYVPEVTRVGIRPIEWTQVGPTTLSYRDAEDACKRSIDFVDRLLLMSGQVGDQTWRVRTVTLVEEAAGGPRLLAERDEARSQRDSLLARIHRDGGHYVTQHGLEKAIEDAHEVSATRTVQLDEARALLKELEWCIPNAFDVPTSCPVCWGSKNTGGHAPDCRLAAAIKETTHAK